MKYNIFFYFNSSFRRFFSLIRIRIFPDRIRILGRSGSGISKKVGSRSGKKTQIRNTDEFPPPLSIYRLYHKLMIYCLKFAANTVEYTYFYWGFFAIFLKLKSNCILVPVCLSLAYRRIFNVRIRIQKGKI